MATIISPEEAKKLAAGPLGHEMSKFPLRFAKMVLFGDLPSRRAPAMINNGTASLVDLGNGPMAITCSHVIASFRERLRGGRPSLFQIGNSRLDPVAQLISENENLDLAVIGLRDDQAKEIIGDGDIGSSFFRPVSWPPKRVAQGDFIAFGGFPGQWRTQSDLDTLEFGTYSVGASGVTTVGDSYFVAQFEREYWVQVLNNKGVDHLADLGGLSGGPAFVQRGLRFDFVGVTYEFSSNYELLYLRHSGLISSNGQIEPCEV
jgi:hypothetical protein